MQVFKFFFLFFTPLKNRLENFFFYYYYLELQIYNLLPVEQ